MRIRLQKLGKRHQPFFRVVAADARVKQTGRVKEVLGTYNPSAKDDSNRVKLNRDRVQHWLDRGAQASETLIAILKAEGLLPDRLKGKPGAK